MNGSNVRVYEMHQMDQSVYWFSCVSALLFGSAALIISTHAVDGRWAWFGFGIVFTLVGASLLIRPQTVVLPDVRIVRRIARLFGRFPVWTSDYPFSEFIAVVIQYNQRTGEFDDPDCDSVWLLRRTGRKLLICYSHASRPVEESARRLAADLQIEIQEMQATLASSGRSSK